MACSLSMGLLGGSQHFLMVVNKICGVSNVNVICALRHCVTQRVPTNTKFPQFPRFLFISKMPTIKNKTNISPFFLFFAKAEYSVISLDKKKIQSKIVLHA